MLSPMDEDITKKKKQTKHERTNFDAGFVMKGDLTDNKSL